MREIKFRAWDTRLASNKKITSVVHIDFKNRFVEVTDKMDYFSRDSLDFMVLMQYTGMHDLNEVEIYEGDILQSASGNKYVVEYYENGFYLNDVTKTQFDESYEIVGNIYKNPELLEAKQS